MPRSTQPSLSQQIIKLEEEVGERLFERTQRKALLTPAGSLLLPHAVSILEAVRVGQQEIREMGGKLRGKIILGALPTIAPYLLPDIIYSFRKKYPAVDLTLHEDATQQLLRALEENELDLAFISQAPRNPRIHGLRPRREIALALSRERKPSLCVVELTKFVQDRRLRV